MMAPKAPPRDFWEWAFENSGKNALAWVRSAEDLSAGARAVQARVFDVEPLPGMHSLAAVQAMLLGFALECLLKAVWIKAGNTLTREGRYVRVPGAGDHELRQLATAAKVVLSDSELLILDRLTPFMKFAGRYPIATTVEQMRPVNRGSGSEVPTVITKADLDAADRLTERLMESALPWK